MRRPFDLQSHPPHTRALILAAIATWSVVSYLLISRFVLQATQVVGSSMLPTLQDGQRYVVHRWVYHFRAPRRGDIVAVAVPGYDGLSVKRIVAGPGDTVTLRESRVFVNNLPLRESYLAPGTPTNRGFLGARAYRVAPDCYFVLGDNRMHSTDSRYFGAVRKKWIIGMLKGQVSL